MDRECANCSGGLHGLCVGPACGCGCLTSRRLPSEREVDEVLRILRKAGEVIKTCEKCRFWKVDDGYWGSRKGECRLAVGDTPLTDGSPAKMYVEMEYYSNNGLGSGDGAVLITDWDFHCLHFDAEE